MLSFARSQRGDKQEIRCNTAPRTGRILTSFGVLVIPARAGSARTGIGVYSAAENLQNSDPFGNWRSTNMSGHGHVDPTNKKVALLISILALVLAFAETLGKGAQTTALSENIEAANLWSFFQAKTIRSTTLRTAAETLQIQMAQVSRPESVAAMQKRIADWNASIARYDSEPSTQEGRKELAARAKAAENRRDYALAAYHNHELASAAIQIAIVLASAEIITGVSLLLWLSGGLGVIGIAFCILGFFAPTAAHLF